MMGRYMCREGMGPRLGQAWPIFSVDFVFCIHVDIAFYRLFQVLSTVYFTSSPLLKSMWDNPKLWHKNQRSKSQFFIQTSLEEILKKSYHKSGWIIGSTDPYITLKKNQKMICDPRFVVRPTLIFTTAEDVLFASAVNYKLRFTSLPLFNMLKEREK